MPMPTEFNVTKLHTELEAAGIPIDGCASDGRIDYKPEATQAQIDAAEVIKTNHTISWYIEERRSAYPDLGDQFDAIYKWMKDNSHVVPGFTDLIDTVKATYPKP